MIQVQNEVIWTATKIQREAFLALLNSNVNELFFGGAMRGGKSFFGVGATFALACNLPYFSGGIFRETLPALKLSIMPIVNYFLTELQMSKYFEFNKSEMKLYGQNGSLIHLLSENKKGDPNFEKIRGLPLNFAFIDETAVSKEFYDLLLTRIGTNFNCKFNGKSFAKILCTSNPTKSWVKNYFFDNWKKNTLKKGLIYIPAKVLDNPYAPQEWIETQKEILPPHLFKMFMEGDWDLVEEKFWDYENIEVFDQKDFERATQNLVFDFVVDVAFTEKEKSDFTSILCYTIDYFGNLWIKDVKTVKLEPAKVSKEIFNYVVSTSKDVRSLVEIEGFGGGKAIISNVSEIFKNENAFYKIQEYFYPIISKENLGRQRKAERGRYISNIMRAGKIKIQNGAWNYDFLAQIKAFPYADHDDMVDTLIMAALKLLTKFSKK